ncbi:hypothetical protein [Deinococcus yunweiensis]|uniref:hypothetical protein n=1 Tax=Deinococcus yunweiensis TaxID=367282 RepID=UPI00398F381D
MKKLLALPMLALLIASCGNGTSPDARAYTITMEPLGYSVDTSGVYTIPEVTIELFSHAGAADVRTIDYTAVILNTSGARAAANNSQIVPAYGTMFGGARGGYTCRTTAQAQCTWMSSDANFIDAGPQQWASNRILKAIMPFEWAVAHNTSNAGDTAGWYAEFTFRAVQTNGNTVTWKQNYQIVAPAGS